MSNPVMRKLRILQLIPRKKDSVITIPRIIDLLAEDGIDTNHRTVQRDMNELSVDYPITCNDNTRPFEWFWTGKDTLAIPAMSPATAMTFHLAEKILKPLMPTLTLRNLEPNLALARQTLSSKNKSKARRWLKKVIVVPHSMHLIKAPIKETVFERVSQALYDEKQLELTYLAASNKTGIAKTYPVHPYGLIHRDTTAELVARIDGKDGVTRFLLHRIQSAKKLSTKSQIPPDFNLNEYIKTELAHPLSGQLIRFKAWVKNDGQAYNHILETRLSPEQKIKYVDDGLIISAEIHETIELKWWILGMGDRIKVLKPETLKQDIAKTTKAAAKLYK